MAIHYAKKWLFVADDGGNIIRTTMELSNPIVLDKVKRSVIIDKQSGLNFEPSLLSVDWLNDHLYILGKHVNASQPVWEINRCALDGSGMTVAIGGLFQKPLHMEVDPYNGNLYWVITGFTPESGLYRLDLADISNGVKHKGKHIYLPSNPGAFAIQHRQSKVIVALQANNTFVSVGYDK